jgi:hypothetical protein
MPARMLWPTRENNVSAGVTCTHGELPRSTTHSVCGQRADAHRESAIGPREIFGAGVARNWQ